MDVEGVIITAEESAERRKLAAENKHVPFEISAEERKIIQCVLKIREFDFPPLDIEEFEKLNKKDWQYKNKLRPLLRHPVFSFPVATSENVLGEGWHHFHYVLSSRNCDYSTKYIKKQHKKFLRKPANIEIVDVDEFLVAINNRK